MAFLALGCRKPHDGAVVPREILRKRSVTPDIQQMPVIESGAFQLCIVNLKTHRFHQMQAAPRHCAGSRDIAGILRDFRLDQYDIQHDIAMPYHRLPGTARLFTSFPPVPRTNAAVFRRDQFLLYHKTRFLFKPRRSVAVAAGALLFHCQRPIPPKSAAHSEAFRRSHPFSAKINNKLNNFNVLLSRYSVIIGKSDFMRQRIQIKV